MTLINHEIINKDDIPLLLFYILRRSGFYAIIYIAIWKVGSLNNEGWCHDLYDQTGRVTDWGGLAGLVTVASLSVSRLMGTQGSLALPKPAPAADWQLRDENQNIKDIIYTTNI